MFNVTDKIQHYMSVQTRPKIAEHNTRGEQNKVYAISEGYYAFALVVRVVAGFAFEAGFVFAFEAGALVAALVALMAAALAAGYRVWSAPVTRSRITSSSPS